MVKFALLCALICFILNCNAEEHPTTPFTAVVRENFAAWDTDHDGRLSRDEIDDAVTNPQIKGGAAAAVAVLKSMQRGYVYKNSPVRTATRFRLELLAIMRMRCWVSMSRGMKFDSGIHTELISHLTASQGIKMDIR